MSTDLSEWFNNDLRHFLCAMLENCKVPISLQFNRFGQIFSHTHLRQTAHIHRTSVKIDKDKVSKSLGSNYQLYRQH